MIQELLAQDPQALAAEIQALGPEETVKLGQVMSAIVPATVEKMKSLGSGPPAADAGAAPAGEPPMDSPEPAPPAGGGMAAAREAAVARNFG